MTIGGRRVVGVLVEEASALRASGTWRSRSTATPAAAGAVLHAWRHGHRTGGARGTGGGRARTSIRSGSLRGAGAELVVSADLEGAGADELGGLVRVVSGSCSARRTPRWSRSTRLRDARGPLHGAGHQGERGRQRAVPSSGDGGAGRATPTSASCALARPASRTCRSTATSACSVTAPAW